MENEQRKLVQLQVMHSWGGGLERWVQDYCNTDNHNTNLVLKSIGNLGIPGQRMALYQNINDQNPLKLWELKSPIYATSITSLEYCQILEEIILDFQIEKILVSSFIGHSLDILNTGLKTIIIGHDFYPFCPAINIFFKKICTECNSEILSNCYNENPFNRFFPNQPASSWLAIRQVFLELIKRNEITIVIPSNSVKKNLIELEPEFKKINFTHISHGVNLKPESLVRNTKQGKLKILILGSLALQKGLKLFQECYQELTEIADIYLLGCGEEGLDFRYKQGIKIVATKYSIEELPLKIKEISPDFGMLLSVWPETFSYTLSELMIFGIPTLATKIGSFEDRIKDCDNGFLVEANKDAIITKIHWLNTNRHLLNQVAENLNKNTHKNLPEMINEYQLILREESSQQLKISRQLNSLMMFELEWKKIQSELQEIDELKTEITAMKSSKFWKLRTLWFKLKKKLKLSQ